MKKQLMIVLLIAISYLAKSQAELQVFEQWGKGIGEQAMYHKSITKTDGSGNVYIAGATMSSGFYDMLVAKYNSSGVLQWTFQYDGYSHFHDFATGMFIDNSGNVYVTGTITDSLMTRGSDLATLKIDNTGALQWYRLYNGSANYYDAGADIVVDNGTGDVYVTGGIHTSASYPYTDAITIKYNSSGTQQWATIYNNTTYNLSETGARLRLTGTGKVVVSGAIQSAASTYIYGVLEYSTSTGAQIGGTALGSGSSDIEYFGNLQIDNNHNYYIAGASYNVGTTGYDYYVMKLDSTLAVQWENTYDGGYNKEDMANDLQVDASGNVYVTGYTTKTGEGKNITTLKYNSSGSLQWNVDYNDTLNGDDAALAMTINASGEIYITGYDSTYLGSYDYVTIKYDASGAELWKIRNDGMKHLKDKATNIAIDSDGNIVVTGQSETAPGTYEYATVSYVEKNIITPTDAMGESPSNSFLYYRNKGQLISTDSTFIPAIKYYTNNTYPNYYFKNDTMSMVFASIDTIPATDDTLHRIDMMFRNANNMKIFAMKEQSSYLNYFLGHCPDGVTGIHGNQYLVVPDLYANIDLIYSSNQNGIKYYFVIKPGGLPKHISWEYFGATSTYHNTGTEELTITSDIGSITFDQPLMYQIDGNNDTINGSSQLIAWDQDGTNSYLFANYGGYDINEILIIEVDCGNTALAAAPAIQNLEWSTYAGGDYRDGSTSITVDANGDPYITGSTTSANFPINTTNQTSSAAYPNLLGTQDIFVMKFDKNNKQVRWASYLGGSGAGSGLGTAAFDMANDIKAYTGNDPNKKYVFITGTTWSADFPPAKVGVFANADYHTNTSPVKQRLIVAAFKQDVGFLHWSTCHEGTSTLIAEEGTSLDIDEDGLLIVGGAMTGVPASAQTSPSFAFVTPSGAYTKTTATGMFLLFDTNYQIKWCTMIGSRAGWVNDVKIMKEGTGRSVEKKAYVTGRAAGSSTHPIDLVPNPGNEYYQNSFGGGLWDAYICRLNIETTYALEYSTYWGGSGDESGVAITGKNFRNLYFAGYTTSSDLTTTELPDPGGSAYHTSTLNGYSDGFILRFDPTNQNDFVWGTLYGGNQNDAILDLCLDVDNTVYATGETRSTSNFVQTTHANYYDQSVLGNNNASTKIDAFILAFNSSNADIHSTYFGGINPDCGAGIASDGTDYLYITGTAVSDQATFPLVEFSTVSPLDWYDGNFTNNSPGGVGIIQTYDRTSSFTYDNNVYEVGTQNSDAFIASFKITTSLSVSISENENPSAVSDLLIYPNPVVNSLTIKGDKELLNSDVFIMNTLGQLVKNAGKLTSNTMILDISDLSSGVYVVAVKNKSSYIRVKFIKQ